MKEWLIYLVAPLVNPIHFFISQVVGGVFTIKVKERLLKADKITGVGVSFTQIFVLSLNCLQNSAIFNPRGPRAYKKERKNKKKKKKINFFFILDQ